MIDFSQPPHPITFVEWLAGFMTLLGLFVCAVLISYLWRHRTERWQPHFRIAAWFVVALIGGSTVHGWIWGSIFTRPELDTRTKLEQAYPTIGALPWEIGSVITTVAVVALSREFGEAYVGRLIWLPAIVVSALVPLISMWYQA
jgi:hypothetical protein